MKCFELIGSFEWVLFVNNGVLLLVLKSDLTQLSANISEALFVYILLSPPPLLRLQTPLQSPPITACLQTPFK